MSSDNGVFVFPDVAKAATNGIDPNLDSVYVVTLG